MNFIKELKELASNKSLLIIEDEIELNDELVMLFELFFKKIDTAYNGEEGYKKILENDYDIIISDIDMPILDGLKMIERLKKLNNSSKFILLSGRVDENKEFIKSLGIDFFCYKPYSIDDLSSYIIKILESNKIK